MKKLFVLFFILINSVSAGIQKPPLRDYPTFKEFLNYFFRYYYDYTTQISTLSGLVAYTSGTPYTITIGNGIQFTDSTLSVKESQISHLNISDIGTNTHTELDSFKSSKAQASGLASLDSSSLVVQNPANATATPTASKIPIADSNGMLTDWIIKYDVPDSTTSSGNQGTLTIDSTSNYLYVCIASNTWRRVELSEWSPAVVADINIITEDNFYFITEDNKYLITE